MGECPDIRSFWWNSLVLADQTKGRPTEGVGIGTAYGPGGLPQRFCLITVRLEGFVEESHRLCRALVVDIPERYQNSLSTRIEQAPYQAEQFIAADHHIQTGAAAA